MMTAASSLGLMLGQSRETMQKQPYDRECGLGKNGRFWENLFFRGRINNSYSREIIECLGRK